LVTGWLELLVALAVAVAITPATAPAAPTTALPSAAAATATASSALFRPVAALAVDGPVPPGFEWDRRGLPTAGADHRCARAHAGAACAVAAFVLGMGWSVAAATAAARALFGLATGFAPPGRGVSAFLEELLFTSGEHKFLTAVATSK
jgi:hypothetical protein